MRLEDEIKQPTFQSEAHKAYLNVVYTAGWLGQRQAAAFKPYGLTSPQFNVLRILRGQHPLPATVALLIERMLDKTSNASRIVDKLEEKKLVTRTVCPANRRAVDIRITEAGLRLLRQIDEDEQANPARSSLDKLSTAEQRQLNTLLDKIRA
jgi:DNA-binding MarR family transcriptional regulator